MTSVRRKGDTSPRTLVAAVKRDLAVIGREDRELARSTLAVSALMLAGIVDDKSNSAGARTSAAKELREALDRLRELLPAADSSGDGVDDLQARARLKLAGSK